MSGPFLNRSVAIREGAYLPHWTMNGGIYHTVFRLADSLPSHVVERYRSEREALLAEIGNNPSPSAHDRLQELFGERIEHYLDAGHGASWLSRPTVADLVADAVRHFNHVRYELHAWCVMPNHVHVVCEPLSPHGLSLISHSWKSFTAKEANRLLNRTGVFWQKESYDRVVRDEADLARTIRYVQDNPTRAGLRNWPWVWP